MSLRTNFAKRITAMLLLQIEHVNGQRRHINRSCKDIMYGQKLS